MQDPLQENIAGEKRVVHTVEHRVNWGHVALAVAVLAVIAVAVRAHSDGSSRTTKPSGGVRAR